MGFCAPAGYAIHADAGQVLAKSALAAVKAVAENYGDADGDTKRKVAFDLIIGDLKNQGISMATSLVYAAIEIAVQKMKEDDE